ncbi:ABC transporter ATP-binding protein [Schinkia azotoformans]|uniref:ABC transporter ATP-binding protein n=1 Tax=Schinkia azotoformans TaxID=1454 RepID=UPI002DB97D7C|nr:ABC transporter ATP-binding protein [Schinkia azotoformans]MEC1718629.1 ABC transporter ATP-binding protein [Schinkia azotoformans]MEC1743003.1 ABC transporter ATP-binding protein [Schinkia azotoformans]MEC1746840.1 ABC transporter ATP-binding protein [Schinkia azotoformans]MEC1769330.1 ABC transporter ATP-binding protein [Schinkia azotoformans]MEC1789693.1 ABC transporter ATP-binding protein [Schinkia azotoformans]
MNDPLLQVENLSVFYQTANGKLPAVRGLEFSLEKGETLAIVGESGSGKTATALSVIGLLPENGKINNGSIRFSGNELVGNTEKDWDKIRGQQIAMVFQDPMSALNPVLKVGRQLEEAILLREEKGITKAAVHDECIALLKQVGVTEPSLRLKQYPHQLSGGIRQRVMIAIALASKPQLLIADEPTTALDSTIKKQILELLAELKRKMNLSILLITHDLAETVTLADKIMVMYAGKMIEFGLAEDILENPQHPYTQALLQAFPRMEDSNKHRLFALEGQPPNALQLPDGCSFHPRCIFAKERCKRTGPSFSLSFGHGHKACCSLSNEEKQRYKIHFVTSEHSRSKDLEKKSSIKNEPPILEVNHLTKHFQVGSLFSRKQLKAVDGVSFTVERGEITAIVGESGCGKSTLWQTAVGIYKPTAGSVNFLGKPLSKKKDRELFHRQLGFVFQNSFSSLNPRMSIGEAILEPLLVAGWKVKEGKLRVIELLELVGIPPDKYRVFPHEMSGGQRQRVAIARALAVNPKMVILDEPVSSLDVSIQAQIVNLLKELQANLQVSMIFISHDLPLVKYIADKVIVMYGGKIVEAARCTEIFQNPKHPYTKALIAAATPAPGGTIKDSTKTSYL